MDVNTCLKNERMPGLVDVGGPSRRGSRSRMQSVEINSVPPRAKHAITQRTLNCVFPKTGMIAGKST